MGSTGMATKGDRSVGGLRTLRVTWDHLRSQAGTRYLHRKASPHISSAIHRAVLAAPGPLIPTDLELKHIYDYHPIEVPVSRISRRLKTSAWRRDAGRGLARLQAAMRFSGGWKALQRHPSRNFFGRFVADGDWDLRVQPLRQRLVIDQLFTDGRDPVETNEYQRLGAFITTGQWRYTRGMSSTEDLDRYFAALIAAYEDIATAGYRTQVSLGEDGADEVRVCVDRHGHLAVFGGGSHRLAIADHVGIDRIPVIVKRVHAAWVDDWQRRTGTDVKGAIQAGLGEISQ